MSHSRLCSEIITRTARAVGGEEALARVLKEDPQDVKAWARGTREAPERLYQGPGPAGQSGQKQREVLSLLQA